ncbi:hypothetical protein COP2_006792 [Malus domestica]
MPEGLQTMLLQMLQRLEKASTGFREETDLVPPEGKRLKTSLPEKLVVDKPAVPFSEVPVNMINMTWAEKGKERITKEPEEKRLAEKPIGGVIKTPEYPKAAIIKGMVMCSKCQCECELEIPPAGVLIDRELIRRKEEDVRKEAAKRLSRQRKKTLPEASFND